MQAVNPKSVNLSRRWPSTLHDVVRVNAAATFSTFTTPIGQGTSLLGTGTKSKADTNMQAAGVIPAGFKFVARAFGIEVLAVSNGAVKVPSAAAALTDTLLNDIVIALQSTFITLIQDQKEYDLGLASHWPAGPSIAAQLTNLAAVGTVTGVAQNGQSGYGNLRPFNLKEGWSFEPLTSLSVNLTCVAAPSSGVDLRLAFYGEMLRAV